MTSKAYFTIAGIFVIAYIVFSFTDILGVPSWIHQVCTVIFAAATFLGLQQKKKEKQSEK
jgi:uncharacterized protein (DUF983 family)